ncbi:hypothetical protein SESBI_46942 [Sesbania bispinosa]|nr:hypothetical protein SESBI_46942 [Sesbania bispinosa]
MAPRKSSTSKAKRPNASLATKKPATGKASPLCKKARPSRGFRNPDLLQTTSTSKAIILASSVPTQPQASQKASASSSRKGAPSPKVGSSSAHAHEEGEYAEIQNEISRRWWEFFCRIAGQGRQTLTHEFYTNGWKIKGEEWPQFTTYVRGKEVHFDVEHMNKILCFPDALIPSLRSFESFCTRRPDFNEIIQSLCCHGAAWLPLNQPKPKALKMGDLLPIPRAWGVFIIASILSVLHDTTLLLDRAKLLFAIMRRMDIEVGAVISKEMENIMVTEKKSLAYSSLITLLCLDAGKKQPDALSTSRPSIPRHQTQAEINQMILDNQAALAHRQEVLYDSLRRGQLILVKNLVDIPGRVQTEAPFFLHSGDLKDDALGEHLGH